MQVNTNAVFKWCLNLLREKCCPKLPGPYMEKIVVPHLLNHERNVINHIILESWVKFH